MFAGPVSNARTLSASALGIRVRFAIPPRFSRATGACFPNSTKSANGTSGAPSPPAAMFALRKSAIVGTPVRSATREASPSWSVARFGK